MDILTNVIQAEEVEFCSKCCSFTMDFKDIIIERDDYTIKIIKHYICGCGKEAKNLDRVLTVYIN